MNHYALTWQEGSFTLTACVVAAASKKARDELRKNSSQRFEKITAREAKKYEHDGYSVIHVNADGSRWN